MSPDVDVPDVNVIADRELSALFARRARLERVTLDLGAVFAEIERRDECVRRGRVRVVMLAAAVACVVVAFVGARAAGSAAVLDPATADLTHDVAADRGLRRVRRGERVRLGAQGGDRVGLPERRRRDLRAGRNFLGRRAMNRHAHARLRPPPVHARRGHELQ
jgi:hypothetical protein